MLQSVKPVSPSKWKDYVFDIRVIPARSTVYKQSCYGDRVVHELRRKFSDDAFRIVVGYNIPVPPDGFILPLVEDMSQVRIELTEAEVGYIAGYPGEWNFPDNAFNILKRFYA